MKSLLCFHKSHFLNGVDNLRLRLHYANGYVN